MLLECFITFLKYIMIIGRVSDSIYLPLMVNNVSFPRKTAPKFHEISHFGCPFSMGNGLLCSEERYPLLLECSIRSLRCIMIMARVSDCLHKPLMVNTTMSFLQNTYSQLACKKSNLGTLSAREMECCVVRSGTHCCLSVS